MKNLSAVRREQVTFLVVGLTSFGIHVAVQEFWRRVTGDQLWGNAAGYAIATLYQIALHNRVTFRQRTTGTSRASTLYLLMKVVMWFVNQGFFLIVLRFVNIGWLSAAITSSSLMIISWLWGKHVSHR